MRAAILPSVTAALFGFTAFGQSPADENVGRVLHFTHNQTAQDMQEVATVILSISEIRQASANPEQQSLSLRGTAAQIALSEWLFNQLDRTPDTVVHEYKLGGDDIVRLFYLPHAATVQDLQEEVTLVRSLGEIRLLFTYNAPRAAVLRGTASQMSLAEWLFAELAKPANRPGAHQYHMAGDQDDEVRLIYLKNTQTFQDFQELTVLVRTLGRIRRVFTYNTPRVVALRGPGEQMALAEWLFKDLDDPEPAVAQPRVVHEYRIPSEVDNSVRVFYLAHALTPEREQGIARQVRETTGNTWLCTYSAHRAIAFRGTAAQIALANQLIAEQDK